MKIIVQYLIAHKHIIRALFFLTVLVVLSLSLMPGYIDIRNVTLSDKVEHFAAYLALGGLVGLGWTVNGLRPFLLALFGLTLLGGAIEVVQGTPFIGRTASWLDLLADAVGAGAGLLGSMFLYRYR